MTPIEAHVQPGTILGGKYRIESIIGVGGMGVIARATNIDMHTRVAVKVLHPTLRDSDEAFKRFLQEARAVGRLSSPHIVKMFDVTSREPEMPFMVMELLEGVDLDEAVQRRGKLAPAVAVELVRQACKGVGVAHAAGILHRDLKPANLFLAKTPEGGAVVKVLDFGLMKGKPGSANDAKITHTNDVYGSPCFMSPEQINGSSLDERADVWALGAILFELLTGHTAFAADTIPQTLVNIAIHEPPPIEKFVGPIPHGLQEVVSTCLAKDRVDRYASAEALAVALAPFRSDVDLTALFSDRSADALPPLPLVVAGPATITQVEVPRFPPAKEEAEEDGGEDQIPMRRDTPKKALVAIACGAVVGVALLAYFITVDRSPKSEGAPLVTSSAPAPSSSATSDEIVVTSANVPQVNVADLPTARPQQHPTPVASPAPQASRPRTTTGTEIATPAPSARPDTVPYPEFGRRK